MNRIRQQQHGQVAVIFALMATVVVGLIALAVDYGLLTNHHRNLQAFVDEAATAGAAQLPASPVISDRQNARQVAYDYLRDNLLNGGSLPDALKSGNLKCVGKATVVDWTQDVNNCQLPSPFDSYTFSVVTPVQQLSNATLSSTWTLAVSVSESVASAVAGVIGQGALQAGATAVATHNFYQQFPWALYSDGCVQTGNSIAVVKGDVFIDNCGVNAQSSGQAAFCVNGNLEFGPNVTQPLTLMLPNVTLPTCMAGTSGQVLATGNVGTLSQPPPALAGPSIDTTKAAYSCLTGASGCPVPTPVSGACINHPPFGANLAASACYQPGAYCKIPSIANNLNPGLYVITADGSCDPSNCSPCDGAQFLGNTLNANWTDVQHSCWAAPNVPATNTFTLPCLDGFSMNPTTPVDPMCPIVAPLAAPTFTLTGVANDPSGNLDTTGGPTGTNYWVVVTAYTNTGETTGTERLVNVNSNGVKKGALDITINSLAGAAGYRIYGPALAPGTETFNQSVGAAGTYRMYNLPAPGGLPPPAVNTSSNAQLPNPTFTATAAAGGSLNPSNSNTTYYVRVTALNPMGETLSTEVPVLLTPGQGTVNVSITRESGATGYMVYGPSTASNTEVAYNASNPTVAQATSPTISLTQNPTGSLTYPQFVNRSGCSATGFYNIPQRSGENDGVTFVLFNKASICLNIDNSLHCSNAVGSSTPTVMWSPALTAGQCNPALNDGVFPVFSATGTGQINLQGSATSLNISGTVYAPNMSLNALQNAQFTIYGQLIIHSTNIQTGNSLNPAVYNPYDDNRINPCLAVIPSGVLLIQ